MNRTLLYIDRDPSVRLLLHKGLSPAGFDVLEAEDAAQGRALARETRPAAVLIDIDGIDMPTADLVEALRRTPGLERAALFASTAEDRPDHLERAASCGFAAVLLKPLDLDALASHLEPYVLSSRPATDGTPPDPTASGVPSLVLRTLAPLVESLVDTVSAADAVLVLARGVGRDVVVAAAHSVRRGTALPAIGTRATLDATPWLADAIRTQQPVVIDATGLQVSSLVPAGVTSLLVVSVAGERGHHGAIILGERRRRTFAFPPAQVEETVREAGRIALVIEQLERLRTSITDSRRQLERYRTEMTRTVAGGGAGEPDEHQAAVADLSLHVAQTLGLGAGETELVRHLAHVHDAGLTWLRQAVLPHVRVSPGIRQRLLDLRGDLGCEILGGLGWPAAMVDAFGPTVGAASRHDEALEGLEIAARVVGTVTAYYGRLAGTPGRSHDRALAIAALTKEATGPVERQVIAALSTTLTTAGPAAHEG